jgi:multidrug efflux pump subunit AcrA (membrane-fusion protein)
VFTPDVEGDKAIRLPLTAIHDPHGTPLVWIVDPGTHRVSQRAVKLGAAQKDGVLITEGLQAGDIVVSAGVNQLHNGQKVKTAGGKS